MGKKTPAAPNPQQTAAAQTGTNLSTATANAYLGNINEVTPDGSTTVNQTGMQSVYDPYTKQTYQVPTFTRNTTLSQGQQAIKNQQDAASLNLATLGKDLSGTLGQQLTGNFKLGNESTEARLMELGRKRLDPKFAQQRSDLETQLSNQGIKLGSAAYDRAMRGFGETQNDAYNSLLLSGRGQASQEQLTEDNQRINQISALMNGGQVSQPSFMGANMPQMATTDVAGLENQAYQARLNAAQQKQAALGGLFSGLGSAATLMLSDRRAKTDIKKIGTLKGENIYSYRYKGQDKSTPKTVGVMAQEIERKKPDAVHTLPGGLKAVDYSKALSLGA